MVGRGTASVRCIMSLRAAIMKPNFERIEDNYRIRFSSRVLAEELMV
ncbi:MAG: hypothetical protein KatS3mg020_0272 [Fimbriimonadales bacterium]|nr:MAG: hypothetical protein KatS3mg020_0272 [Fimbriimonadales bacterium]